MIDFIDYLKCDIPVKDVTKLNRVVVIGTTIYKFFESNGQDILFPYISYHLTQTDVQLFSPKTYHQMHSVHSIFQVNQVTMYFPNNRIQIPIDIGGTDLPVVHNSFVTEHQSREIGP